MPIPGAASPRIKQPNQKGWYKTTLGWMSIGYETQLPIINTLAFYNAIANNGKLVKPRLLKSVKKNGKKSIAYSISMRSHEGTLTDEQADGAMKRVLKALSAIGAELRG